MCGAGAGRKEDATTWLAACSSDMTGAPGSGIILAMDLWPFGKAVGGRYGLSPAWCLVLGSVVGNAWPAPWEGAFRRRWAGLRPPGPFSGLAGCIGRCCLGLRTQSPFHANRLTPAGNSVGPTVAGAWAKRDGAWGSPSLPIPLWATRSSPWRPGGGYLCGRSSRGRGEGEGVGQGVYRTLKQVQIQVLLSSETRGSPGRPGGTGQVTQCSVPQCSYLYMGVEVAASQGAWGESGTLGSWALKLPEPLDPRPPDSTHRQLLGPWVGIGGCPVEEASRGPKASVSLLLCLAELVFPEHLLCARPGAGRQAPEKASEPGLSSGSSRPSRRGGQGLGGPRGWRPLDGEGGGGTRGAWAKS